MGRILIVLSWVILQYFGVGYRTRRWKKHLRPVWHHSGAVARVDQLHGTGRIYLVQVGEHKDPYAVVEMATWLREEYGVDTQILPAMSLDDAGYDSGRKLYVAERIDEQMKREHAGLAADPHAFLIRFTDEAMYSVTDRDLSTFSWRDGGRTAVISSDGLKGGIRSWDSVEADTPDTRSRDRLRRILLKDVAVLFWHLPLNNDAASVLYYKLNPELQGDTLYETDLDPMHTPWGQFFSDPCFTLTHAAGAAVQVQTPLLRECAQPESAGAPQEGLSAPGTPPETAQERMEVRLAYGLLTEKHTDFYLPGALPVRLERATNNRWQMPGAFGMSGSHNYDRWLVSHDVMNHIEVSSAGGWDVDLARRPWWLPVWLPVSLPVLGWNRWVDTNYSGSALSLRWIRNPEHFELARYDGAIEYYLPCEDKELCLLDGLRSATGEALHFERDKRRNLQYLNAPKNNWLKFTHDSNDDTGIRVREIVDSTGRQVKYEYNAKGQLASVTYPSGERLSYEYDDQQNLLVVKGGEAGWVQATLATNAYEKGRLVSETLADGETYRFAYWDGRRERVDWTQVTASDGMVYVVGFGPDGAAVRSHRAGSEGPRSVNPEKEAGMVVSVMVAG